MTRTYAFIIFFSIVLVLYGLINTYIYLRGLSALSSAPAVRQWFSIVFWFLALSYFAARLLERIALSWFTDGLVWIGSFWLGAMAYLVIILLAVDVLRLANAIIPFFPDVITKNSQAVKQTLFYAAAGVVLFTIIGARINQALPQIKTLEFVIHKKSPLRELNVALITDVHLGTIICNSHFKRIVEKINSLNPDIVLFGGDLVDEDIEPVIRQNLGETLRQIKSKYGLYGITGNHEYIGGVEAACRYLTEHGVVMLRDSTVKIADAFVLVGREDVSIRQFEGKQRKPLVELMNDADKSLPVILLDHQPMNLHESAEQGADLQFSGHTHNGQLWPFNYIAEAVYEVSWGYKRIGNTHIYVSCGVGTWGPPMRTGNRPEVVNVKLKFE
ncbi:MAG: metallophosphoesterase [Ignavibacteriae bacterium]|nr:MAG: metallophosphoesterase [Ignavibacteriota bacterium]